MSVEEIEEELYKILHRDFIKFQGELQKNSREDHYICENDLRRIIEDILGYNMSKCQWKDLQTMFVYRLPKCEGDDDDEKNRSVDFLKLLETFNKPSSDWMKKKLSDVHDPPRRSHLLCRLVADTLKFRFHAIDKLYKSYGTGVRGTFTKGILHDLLNSQKCTLSPDEMNVIWAVVEANPSFNTWNYRQILKHLMMNLYKRAEELLIESRKQTSEDSNIDVLKEFRKLHKDDKAKKEAIDLRKIDMALSIKSFKVDQDMAKDTITKMAPRIKDMWKPFKRQLRKLDIMGTATVELFEMKDVIMANRFNLTSLEIDNLLHAYDPKNNGRFDYIAFLYEFAKFPQDEMAGKPSLHFARLRHHVLNQLIKEWKSLIRAFRKLDTKKTSKLDIDQLNGVLLKAGIQLSDDDLYHLFTGFDTNLDGKIDYVEFIEQLLDVLIPHPV